MPKPNDSYSVKQMKDYIRTHKLNKPDVKLGMKRQELINGLQKLGHWDSKSTKPTSSSKKPTKPKPKPTKPKPKPKPKTKPKTTTTKALQDMPLDVGSKISETQMAKRGDDRIDLYDVKLKNGTKLRDKINEDVYTIEDKKNIGGKDYYIIQEDEDMPNYALWTNDIFYEKNGKGFYFIKRKLDRVGIKFNKGIGSYVFK